MGGGKRQHPLLEIGAVVARVTVRHGQHRLLLLFLLTGGSLVVAAHGEGGSVHMYTGRFFFDAERPPSAQGYSREQARNVVGVEPIERTAQTIVVEIGRLDARNIQQTLQGLVLEELGDQVEPSVTEAQAV